MLIDNIDFDPVKDIQEVDQFGFVDLRKAFETGIVDGTLDFNESSFNEVEDLNSIVGKPRDIFEAMQYGESIGRAAEGAAAPSGEGAD